MKRSEINKKIANTLKFIYRVGLLKSFFILLVLSQADAEYEIKWKGHHVHLRKGTSDFNVFKQVMVFGNYEINGIDPEIKTIVDLGANIGLSTLYLKSKYPNATIISVEPEAGNFEILKKNVAALPDVYCLRNAIWNSRKPLEIMNSKKGEYAFYTKDTYSEGGASVDGITVGDIMQQFNLLTIDLLKVDIEGSEKELFAENYSDWLPNVGSIVAELHDWLRPGCASSFFRAVSEREYNLSSKGENVIVNFNPSQKMYSAPPISTSTTQNAGII